MVAGAVGAGLGLTAGELVHRVAGSRIPAPVIAVGDSIIDLSPGSAVRTGIETLGTADKPTLIAATVVLTLLVGATIGHYARHSLSAAFSAFGALTAVGAWAALRQPGASTIGVLLSAAGSAALATATYRGLFAVARGAVAGGAATSEAEVGAQPGTSRRFLLLAGAGTALAALVPFAVRRRNDKPTVQLADGQKPAVAPTGSLDGRLPGLSPYFMPNKDFYRIDTALSAPRVSASDWSLKIGGLVDRPFSISYDELKALPSVEAPVTLSCVSNGVGQDLVGNALWRGVPLAALLQRAGVQPKATQLASFSVDGWSCGFPVDAITPSRTVLVAYEMNGSPLPLEHGFPARLVVAGSRMDWPEATVRERRWATPDEARSLIARSELRELLDVAVDRIALKGIE